MKRFGERVQLEVVASRSRNDAGNVLPSERSGKTLVVVNVPAQHQVRRALRRDACVVQKIVQMLASRLRTVRRINRVVHRNDQRLAAGRVLKLRLEPVNLRLRKLSALRAIAVQANDGRERRQQGPVNIGLRHGVSRRIFRLRSNHRNLRAEIAHKR